MADPAESQQRHAVDGVVLRDAQIAQNLPGHLRWSGTENMLTGLRAGQGLRALRNRFLDSPDTNDESTRAQCRNGRASAFWTL